MRRGDKANVTLSLLDLKDDSRKPRSTTEMNTDLDNDKELVSKRIRRKTTHVRDSKAKARKLVCSPICEERRYSCHDVYASAIRPLRNFRGTLLGCANWDRTTPRWSKPPDRSTALSKQASVIKLQNRDLWKRNSTNTRIFDWFRIWLSGLGRHIPEIASKYRNALAPAKELPLWGTRKEHLCI